MWPVGGGRASSNGDSVRKKRKNEVEPVSIHHICLISWTQGASSKYTIILYSLTGISSYLHQYLPFNYLNSCMCATNNLAFTTHQLVVKNGQCMEI